ncbi:hypothetical protein HCN51_41220 [Nonomuraea sp. FMUSA5-5]|uniref:Uncharacterized protein n=1 Tax=Nonomuraea composti TaxID=2720023 RepID=A0ABX1BDF8_9ACTN|nr:hypothetical protein [Nonomuraea sp. FMUSA5-5]NJP95785.1 hypothetical protein [Nonomuraea sp. FMUSA5-5]
MTGIPTAEGGDASGKPRPGLGYSEEYRETVITYVRDVPKEKPKDPTVEDAYAQHVHDHRNGSYPAPLSAPTQQDDALAKYQVDPGKAQKTFFVKLAEYEDASGRPLPSSPVEQLRRDLQRLQGEGGPSLKVHLQHARLTEDHLGKWQAAQELLATTERTQTTLGLAIERVYSVYADIVEALAATVETAKSADRTAANGIKRT